MCVEFKGGFRELKSPYIVFTSNKHPKDIYNLPDEDVRQFIRRIDYLVDFDDPAHAQALGNTIPSPVHIRPTADT